jgi:hypothetical protein
LYSDSDSGLVDETKTWPTLSTSHHRTGPPASSLKFFADQKLKDDPHIIRLPKLHVLFKFSV